MALGSSIRRYRAGFLFTVALLSAAALFTLWAQVRASRRVDRLVQDALARTALIGRIRVDALLLESATEAHVRASNDVEREAADAAMAGVLARIRDASAQSTRGLPEGEGLRVWKRFNASCDALAAKVRETVGLSHAREAEQARLHLVEQLHPVAVELDSLAAQLEAQNARDTRDLLRQVETLRLRSTQGSAALTLLAVLLSLAVGWQVTRRLRTQEATIQEQLQELGRHNRELDAFASRVAHDLMAPLAPLRGYLTLIRRSAGLKDPGALEMLGHAEAGAARMSELIEALLRFCRAGTRAGSERPRGELDVAVETLLLEVSQTAAAQGVALSREVERGVAVRCPPQLLQVVAQNLLSNAVKYTAGREGARVEVRVAREEDTAVLEVKDNGIGMGERVQAALFQPFFRAPEVRALPGHGLGLATVKRVVEAHGGGIQVHSAEGQGTRVRVQLPLAAPPPATAMETAG
ncbi:HAMP domain-containing histidine kinase [Aggregicoccus sp. 17bor-14]|uniref:sensor histidine kinase n=1 Tax=Myxococcaceae TaxID=31 RepID=UPI00129CF08E|nr:MULTISPECIES: ATP-binding protein [Myxococcaceae]MBF5043660.1 HAMP domain-containing histidine kinase [Simulacricoccus sp. 17bor-14]MRI89418.1 HAMP domain-containing histidine kinase [Aggregicoccus sp. 17bor-14]